MVDIVNFARDLVRFEGYKASEDCFERMAFNHAFDDDSRLEDINEIQSILGSLLSLIAEEMGKIPTTPNHIALNNARGIAFLGKTTYEKTFDHTDTFLSSLEAEGIIYNHQTQSYDARSETYTPFELFFHKIDVLGLPENFRQVMGIFIDAGQIVDHPFGLPDIPLKSVRPYELLDALGILKFDRGERKAQYDPTVPSHTEFLESMVLGQPRVLMMGSLYAATER